MRKNIRIENWNSVVTQIRSLLLAQMVQRLQMFLIQLFALLWMLELLFTQMMWRTRLLTCPQVKCSVKVTKSLNHFVLASGANNLATYKDTFIIAADFEKSTNISYGNFSLPFPLPFHQLTALYNSVPLHSRPLAQNYISNTLLKHLETNSSEKHSIHVATHPLPEPRTVLKL